MAYTLTDGRPGLDGIFTVNSLALNDLSTFPRVKLEELTGYYDMPDTEDPRFKRVGHVGEQSYQTIESGATRVFAGVVQAKTLPSLRAYVRTIQNALRDHSIVHLFTVEPPASVGGIDWIFGGRITGLQIPEQQQFGPHAAPTPWQRQFTLTIRMDDPRFYALPMLDESTGTPGTGVSVTNGGTAPSDPVITLTGISSGADVSVWSGTKRLDFIDVSAAGTMVVNFTDHTAKIGTVEQSGRLDMATSNWWDPFVEGISAGATETVEASGCTGLQVQMFQAAW